MSAAMKRNVFASGIESASLTPTKTREGSTPSPTTASRFSGRSAQLSWCAFLPWPGMTRTDSIFCCHGGSSARNRRTTSAVLASIDGCGARSSSSFVITTTWSLLSGYREPSSARSVVEIAGSSQAGTRCRNTGAAGSRATAASSGSVSTRSYASSTNRHVVSMPFQSSRSLNAARPLKNEETAKRIVQNQSMAAAQSLLGAGRELQDGLALTDEAVLFAGELLEVGGVVAKAVDRLGERDRARAQRRNVPLGARDLDPDGPDSQRAAHAPAHEQRGDEHAGRRRHVAARQPATELLGATLHRVTRW